MWERNQTDVWLGGGLPSTGSVQGRGVQLPHSPPLSPRVDCRAPAFVFWAAGGGLRCGRPQSFWRGMFNIHEPILTGTLLHPPPPPFMQMARSFWNKQQECALRHSRTRGCDRRRQKERDGQMKNRVCQIWTKCQEETPGPQMEIKCWEGKG